jgi:hypothetical protein
MKDLWLLLVLAGTALGCGAQESRPTVQDDAEVINRMPDQPMNHSDEADTTSRKPIADEDLNRIERKLRIRLPRSYREFMLTRSSELLGYTYPLRGKTEYWFDWEFFGFDVDRLVSENLGQREPDMAAGHAFRLVEGLLLLRQQRRG